MSEASVLNFDDSSSHGRLAPHSSEADTRYDVESNREAVARDDM